MSVATIGAAAVAVGGSMLAAKKNAKAQKDAVETPTRSTDIQQALEQAFQSQDTTSITSVMEEIFGSEITSAIQSSMEETSSVQDTTQNTTAQEQTEQTLTRGDAESQEALGSLMSQLQGGGEEQMQAAMNQVLRSGMPAVSNVGARSGSFDGTTQALVQNDLITRAAEAGVNQQNTMNQQLLDAIAASQAGTETTTGTATSEQNTQMLEELLQMVDATTKSSSETQTSETRQAEEENQTSTDTSSTTASTEINDSFTDVGDDVKPVRGSALGDLVNKGKTDDVELGLSNMIDDNGNLIEPPEPDPSAGTGPDNIPPWLRAIMGDEDLNMGGGGGAGAKPGGNVSAQPRRRRK